ncbi:MAG: redoxin domain-containing protein [Breznakibacter sp.]
MKFATVFIGSFFLMVHTHLAVAQTDSTTLVKAGDKVPKFTISNDHKTIDSHQSGNKITWINFFATWCGPCREELPELQKVWDEFKSNPNFELLVVGRQHTQHEVDAFANTQNYTMPFYPDPERLVYSLFATSYIPRNVIIDEKGIVVYSTIGFEKTEFDAMVSFVKKKLYGN